MRGFLVLALICLLFPQSPASAFLHKTSEDKNFITQMYEQELKQENWSQALFYLEKLLLLEPDCELLLKEKAELGSILSQQKIKQAYWLVKTEDFGETEVADNEINISNQPVNELANVDTRAESLKI